MEFFSSWLLSGAAWCWPGWAFSSAVTEHTLCPCLTKPARAAKLQPGIAAALSGKNRFFFSFSQLPFYYYGVFWTTADELCSIFMNIQLLSSFIPSWGMLMGTKWKDCCDSNATLGSPCSRGSWANLDVQATPLCCSFHPDRIMMCSSADHTLLKSSLGKNMVYCSLWL